MDYASYHRTLDLGNHSYSLEGEEPAFAYDVGSSVLRRDASGSSTSQPESDQSSPHLPHISQARSYSRPSTGSSVSPQSSSTVPQVPQVPSLTYLQPSKSPDNPQNTSSSSEQEEEKEGSQEEEKDDKMKTSKPEKKKRTRTLTTAYQASVLNALLAETRFPSTEVREQVGKQIGMSPRRVQLRERVDPPVQYTTTENYSLVAGSNPYLPAGTVLSTNHLAYDPTRAIPSGLIGVPTNASSSNWPTGSNWGGSSTRSSPEWSTPSSQAIFHANASASLANSFAPDAASSTAAGQQSAYLPYGQGSMAVRKGSYADPQSQSHAGTTTLPPLRQIIGNDPASQLPSMNYYLPSQASAMSGLLQYASSLTSSQYSDASTLTAGVRDSTTTSADGIAMVPQGYFGSSFSSPNSTLYTSLTPTLSTGASGHQNLQTPHHRVSGDHRGEESKMSSSFHHS
ncbi:hypothetical protein BT69DRAFT_249800 [Atractiella rhizophila]|nr:hypothetical protein BT69DRAFT_249800 [Atractiella rhizophila]